MALLIPGPAATLANAADLDDGPASAYSGSPFSAIFLGGGASSLVVDAHEFRGTTDDNGALLNGTFTDTFHLLHFDRTEGGALGYYWRLQDADTANWTGYWLVCNGLNWAIKKRLVGGSDAEIDNPSLDTAVVDSSISQGVGIRVYGTTFEVYRYEGNTWGQTPVLSATDATYATGRICVNLPRPSWQWARMLSADPSLTPPAAPTDLIVNAGHVDANDGYTRDEVDEDHPLKTPRAACFLAYATPTDEGNWGDTITVVPTAVADATNADPRMYPAIDHRYSTRLNFPSGFPFGDNSGNAPITVRGRIVDGQVPLMYGVEARGLSNWAFQDMQFGYDVDSGLDYGTLRNLERAKDLTFRRIVFTAGGHQVFYSDGELLYEDCTFHAKLTPGGTNPNDGRAFYASYGPQDADGGESSADITFRGCEFSNIRGNDAIQVSMGGRIPDPQWGTLTVEECLFWNVTEHGEGGNEAFHTDAIQSTGGPEFVIRNNTFIGCSDAFIASDFGQGTVRFEGNLCVGGPAQITIQGYDLFVMRQNTIITFGTSQDASVMFTTRYTGVGSDAGPVDLKVIVENNIVGGFFYRDSSARNHAPGSVYANNLVFTDPGGHVGAFGTHLPGIPELGPSSRLNGLPTTGFIDPIMPATLGLNFELANTAFGAPFDNPGIGDGTELDDYDGGDLYGRPWASPPDVGCLQSDPDVDVEPSARGPYIVFRSPVPGQTDVELDASQIIDFYPKPGEAIDPASITNLTVTMKDHPKAHALLTQLTLGALAENGRQRLTINPVVSIDPLQEGELFELVTYDVALSGAIVDTEGSALTAIGWSWTTLGPDGAAIGGAGTSSAPLTSIAVSNRTTDSALLTLNSRQLEMNPTGMKTLRRVLDQLVMETAGNESDDNTPTVHIGPLT